MTSENLKLWHAIERTDPAHVKPITGKQYSGSSPKPHYLVRKATETFGPVGIGWGYDITSQQIIEGSDGDKLHVAEVRVWYIWEGKRGEVPHVGATPFSGKRKSGASYIDEDSCKKSVTDALVKALSMIGFAGDIFMGRYDDSKYVAELKEEIRQEQQTAAIDEIFAYVQRSKSAITATASREKLISYWSGEEDARKRLRIVKGSEHYDGLYSAFVAHGKALAAASQQQIKEAAE